MSLGDELQQLIQLQVGQTRLGDQAGSGASLREAALGTTQDQVDLLIAFCSGLENGLLRLADEIEDLRSIVDETHQTDSSRGPFRAGSSP